MNNIDNCKSYATEANLIKALTALNIVNDRHLVVCNRAGRFTAIFPASNIKNGDMALYAREGFMTIG